MWDCSAIYFCKTCHNRFLSKVWVCVFWAAWYSLKFARALATKKKLHASCIMTKEFQRREVSFFFFCHSFVIILYSTPCACTTCCFVVTALVNVTMQRNLHQLQQFVTCYAKFIAEPVTRDRIWVTILPHKSEIIMIIILLIIFLWYIFFSILRDFRLTLSCLRFLFYHTAFVKLTVSFSF